MVKELQPHATAESGFGCCSDARSAGPEGRVGVFTGTGGGAEDVHQGSDCLVALGPEEFAGFLRAEDCGVCLYGNVLKSAVLAFGQVRQILVELRESFVGLGG